MTGGTDLNTVRRRTRRLAAIGLCSATLSVSAAPASGPALTDELLAALLDRHTESQLYEQANNPWPGGNYKFDVIKGGSPTVTSSAGKVHVKMPLKIVIAGNAENGFLKLKLACKASFTTVGEVEFTPHVEGAILPLKSQIFLPIPPVMADCDGMQLPVEPYLKAFVEQNKRQWESKIDAQVNAQLVGKS